jgi:NAD(P)-dependent dehydrogenase (short-subunit alcohol dehydrogenase family)
MNSQMDEFRDNVAFITGAASGIGLGIARTLARERMQVVMTDVRPAVLEAAAASLTAEGARILAIPLDVTDRSAWIAAADRAERECGPVSLLCSNAGVNFIGSTYQATYEDWDFGLGVNLGGAINAVHTFVPRMVAAGRPGHVVITSSVSGLFTGGGSGVYATTKYALVGLAESLRADLRSHGIGVSVLCPGPVKSELFESTTATRPQSLAATGSIPVVPPGVSREQTPIFVTAPTGEDVGRRVLQGVRRNDLYIMTHPEIRPVLEARAAALIAALPDEAVSPARIDASRGLLDTSLYARSRS